jgi:gluconokinase
MVIIIMGVSGSGKSTIGEQLADATGGAFFDGDDFHPPANVAKMHAGIPLDDADRLPWLQRLRQLIEEQADKPAPSVIACSALKRTYRDILAPGGDPRVRFVYLQGSFELIAARLHARHGHFMPESLLRSQFDALEVPQDALTVDIAPPPEAIVTELRGKLGL